MVSNVNLAQLFFSYNFGLIINSDKIKGIEIFSNLNCKHNYCPHKFMLIDITQLKSNQEQKPPMCTKLYIVHLYLKLLLIDINCRPKNFISK